MSWHGRLELRYTRDGERTVAHDRHHGPLRVLQRLYPEGDRVCHHVLVHPPGGIVGGDRLEIDAQLDAGTHVLITTPGATRFYRSAEATASQSVRLRVADGARLEWLPLETIAFPGCRAENRLVIELEPSAEMIGWDMLALGLPAAGAAFEAGGGSFRQHLELPGRWLERGTIDARDERLLDSPLGFARQRVLATMWFASGSPLLPSAEQRLLDAAREVAGASPLAPHIGVTAPQDGIVVLRALASRVEPAMALLSAVRGRWRELSWSLDAGVPRVWRT